MQLKSLVELIHQPLNSMDARVTMTGKQYSLSVCDEDHNCCGCDAAGQQLFCVHHMMALAVMFSDVALPDMNGFLNVCVKYLERSDTVTLNGTALLHFYKLCVQFNLQKTLNSQNIVKYSYLHQFRCWELTAISRWR